MFREAPPQARGRSWAQPVVLLLAAPLVGLALSCASAGPLLGGEAARSTQTSEQAPSAGAAAQSGPLLAVPFVAQEPLLCGGAAVEMSLRHAGVRGVLARDFVGLVRPEEGGIRTDELAQAVRELGWDVRAGPSDLATLRSDLIAGRPATVLLRERPGQFHYVLVVGRTADAVVVHDPGRAPGLRIALHDFLSRWEDAGRWALVVRRRTPADTDDGAPARATSGRSEPQLPAVAARDEASPPHPLLVKASDLFRASRWREAAEAAHAASRSDPSDPRAWILLASSRYLAGDPHGALEAWSRAVPPRVDRVSVRGLRRTRHPVAHALLGIRPGEPLFTADLERARRRLALLPSARATSVRYRALPGGLADVEATALERALLPRSPAALTGLLLPAVMVSELDLAAAGTLQAGDALTLSFRWSAARPAAHVGVAAPGFPPTGGVARLEAGWERERHWAETDRMFGETRARGRLIVTDWATGWLRWEAGLGAERWRRAGQWGRASAVLRAAVELSPVRSRRSLIMSIDGAAGGRGGRSYLRWTALGAAELFSEPSKWKLHARILAAGAQSAAPRMTWPGAGTGTAREGLLRAHPMVRDEGISSRTLGNRLLNASLELERPLVTLPAAQLSAATFADAARVTRPSGNAHLLDVGAGLWLTLPGGRLQLNAAAGTDGSKALSLAWRRAP